MTYEPNELMQAITSLSLNLGAFKANVIDVKDVVFDRVFRDICASNACGMYGKCWTCPPDVGEIDDLIANAKGFSHILVYQTVSELEDSYDFEGMIVAGEKHNRLAQELRKAFPQNECSKVLHLGTGGCRLCPVCAKRSNEPCRFPTLAMRSLEAYGIHVSKLAESAGMKYINGQDTVTYFGAVLFSIDGEAI